MNLNFEQLKLECLEEMGYRVSAIAKIQKGEKANIKVQAEYLRLLANKIDKLNLLFEK